MARNVYGLDLGTYDIKVFDKKNSEIWKEKNVIAIEDEKKIFAIGNKAYDIYERAPENIEVHFPMKDGVISRFHDMQYLLQNMLKKESVFGLAPEYVIAVPTDVTEVEKKAFFDLVVHSAAKAKEVHIVERGIAIAVSVNENIQNTPGMMIVDIGAGTTEISVISTGGLVLNRMIKIGGNTFDDAIANLVRQNYEILIGNKTAETLRHKFGIIGSNNNESAKVSGRNLLSGVPVQQEVSSGVVRAAMKEPLAECIAEINVLLERTPPEVLKGIREKGIYLAGGVSNMNGLATYVKERTGYPVHVVKNPEISAVEGIRSIVESKELRKLAFSVLNEGYRWMR